MRDGFDVQDVLDTIIYLGLDGSSWSQSRLSLAKEVVYAIICDIGDVGNVRDICDIAIRTKLACQAYSPACQAYFQRLHSASSAEQMDYQKRLVSSHYTRNIYDTQINALDCRAHSTLSNTL